MWLQMGNLALPLPEIYGIAICPFLHLPVTLPNSLAAAEVLRVLPRPITWVFNEGIYQD